MGGRVSDVGVVGTQRGRGTGTRSGGGDPGAGLDGATAAARPAPPRWRDRRLVAGVLLVLGCALLGSRLLAAADARVLVWSAARDLAAGTVVEAGDLVAVPAAAPDLTAYVAASDDPAGVTLARDLAAGELLPVSGVRTAAAPEPRRLVTVAVEPLHAPPGLEHGERVDVWVTPRDDAAAASPSRATLALEAALVAQVDAGDEGYGVGDAIAVVLDVAAADAESLVSASRQGAVDLVRVPAEGGS